MMHKSAGVDLGSLGCAKKIVEDVKCKKPTLSSGLFDLIGSLDALRRARDCSAGRTQHWLRS